MSEDPKIKAGRNLPAAVASGLVLALLVIVSLVTIKWLFGVLAVAALLVAVHEFVSVLRSKGIHVARTPVYIATAVIPSVAYLWVCKPKLPRLGFQSWLSCCGV